MAWWIQRSGSPLAARSERSAPGAASHLNPTVHGRAEGRTGESEANLRRQKILLFDLPQMLGDLVEGVLEDDDVEIARAEGDFVETVAELRPDVAVVLAERTDERLRDLLEAPKRMQVLVLGGKERHGNLYSLERVGVTLADLTPRTLRGALRIGGTA